MQIYATTSLNVKTCINNAMFIVGCTATTLIHFKACIYSDIIVHPLSLKRSNSGSL